MAKEPRKARSAKELRQQRSAAALRANLARRKEQARARAAAAKPECGTDERQR